MWHDPWIESPPRSTSIGAFKVSNARQAAVEATSDGTIAAKGQLMPSQ